MTETSTKPTIAAALQPAAKPMVVQLVEAFGVTLRGSVYVVIVVAFLACAWRGLDIYEKNAQATAVYARIAIERHEIWKRAVQSDRGSATAEQLSAELKRQTQAVPPLDHPPEQPTP